MGSAPGQLKLVKAGFVVLDQNAAVQKIIAFQYNPETLVRRLDAGAAITSGTGVGSISAGATAVSEVVARRPARLRPPARRRRLRPGRS